MPGDTITTTGITDDEHPSFRDAKARDTHCPCDLVRNLWRHDACTRLANAPFAIGLAGLLLALVVRKLRRATSPERAGAMAALLGLAAHELVDFATEMPGILVVAALLAVAALHEHRDASSGGGRRAEWFAVPALALLLAAVPGVSLLGSRIEDRRAAIEAAIEARDWPRTDRALVQAIEERPGEPMFALLGAYAHLVRRDSSTLQWLNATMRLAPRWYSPHLVAAEWLLQRRARTQAWLELRESERLEPLHSMAVACRLIDSGADGAEAVRVMSGDQGAAYLEAVVEACPNADASTGGRIDAALLALGIPAARRRAAERALREDDATRALAYLEGLSFQQDPAIGYARADALVLAGRATEAVSLLESMAGSGADPTARLTQLARAQAAAGQTDAMRETVHALQGQASGDASRIAGASVLLGELEAAMGHRAQAYEAYDRAAAVDPSGDGLTRAWSLANAAGDARRAQSLRGRVCDANPSASICAEP